MEIVSLLVNFIVCLELLVSDTAAQSNESEQSNIAYKNYVTIDAITADCSSVSYAVQPPTELKCNPVGKVLSLVCDINVTGSEQHSVTWYWSQCVHDAGVSGTAILPGGNSDDYWVQMSNNRASSQLFFQVTDSTLGYYWCGISSAVNVSLRPSIITPVLQPTNTSLPECTTHSVQTAHNFKLGPECAAEGSPTIYSRVPLPSFCLFSKSTTLFKESNILNISHMQADVSPTWE